MPNKEKTYVLKHTAEGLTLVRDRDSDQFTLEDGPGNIPTLSDLQEPRWDHWYQRKLARPWQATLLGMNIEPIKNARLILRTHDDERFKIFRDRLDILQTLLGVEVALYENHVREGDGVNEKYVELAQYYQFAKGLGWSDMIAMRSGLRLDVEPPKLSLTARHENNLLEVLDAVFRCAVKGYSGGKSVRSAAAVIKWLSENGEESIVKEPTLRNWLKQMSDLDERS